MPIQRYNDQNIDLLAAVFQRRYEPNFALGNAVSLLAMLPAIRGVWSFASVDSAVVNDNSGQGRGLTISGMTTGLQGLAQYGDFDGANDYLHRPTETDLQITGALSMGAWVYFDALAEHGILGKWLAAGNLRGYRLYRTAGGLIEFAVSADGTATTVKQSAAVANSTWVFVGGRYTPSTSVSVVVNRTWLDNVAAIPAAIYGTAVDLEAGRTDGGSYLNGRIALAFLAAESLSDAEFGVIYEQTRALFGV